MKTLNVEEVSALTKYSKSRIYKLITSKGIPFYKPTKNGKILFFEDEIINWIKGTSELNK